MFTGLVKEIGKVVSVTPNAEGKELVIQSTELISEIKIDDSVSVNGACQTATAVSSNTFTVQTIHTSLEKSTLGSLRPGDEVNLELAMRVSDRLGGHIVQGHVNDIGSIISIESRGNNYNVKIQVSREQMKYIVKEGSITLDGISLTVSNVYKESYMFEVSIIPHTWDNTVLRNRGVGSKLNIEVDILGKYIENLLFHKNNESKNVLSQEWLMSKGF